MIVGKRVDKLKMGVYNEGNIRRRHKMNVLDKLMESARKLPQERLVERTYSQKNSFWTISSAKSCAKRDFRRKPSFACRLGKRPVPDFYEIVEIRNFLW